MATDAEVNTVRADVRLRRGDVVTASDLTGFPPHGPKTGVLHHVGKPFQYVYSLTDDAKIEYVLWPDLVVHKIERDGEVIFLEPARAARPDVDVDYERSEQLRRAALRHATD